MKVDLRDESGAVKPLGADAIEKISEIVRPAYVDLIMRLSANRKDDMDWWVTSLAVRNTYKCPLYYRLCQLVLIKKCVETGASVEVVVDSVALATILKNVMGVKVMVSVIGAKSPLSHIFGFLYRYSGALYHSLSQYIFAKIFTRKRGLPNDGAILVDIFFSGNSFSKNRIIDRYYPGMIDGLDESERSHIYYTPTHYRVRNYFSYYLKLRKVKDRLLFKENVLGLSDYFYALMHPIRFHWPSKEIDFMGMNVGTLVREALLETFANSSSVEGLLRYRFTKKLQDIDFKPKRIIEWYENQEVDHGAVAGWRKYYPDIEVIGYQGFLASRHYLAMFPTKQEHEFSLLPTKIAVIGQCLIESSKEYFPDLKVELAPAFRFSSVWDARRGYPDEGWYTVLVSLPIHYQNSCDIVGMVVGIVTNLDKTKRWRFHVKPHPTWKKSDINTLAIHESEHVKFVKGDFNVLLDTSDLVVGAASSSCVHAIARGIPAIVIGQPGKLLENPIPARMNKLLWAVCYTVAELLNLIKSFSARNLYELEQAAAVANQFREIQFNPVTRKSIHKFIGLDDIFVSEHALAKVK